MILGLTDCFTETTAHENAVHIAEEMSVLSTRHKKLSRAMVGKIAPKPYQTQHILSAQETAGKSAESIAERSVETGHYIPAHAGAAS